MPEPKTRTATVSITFEDGRSAATVVGNLNGPQLVFALRLLEAEIIERARTGASIAPGRPMKIQARQVDAPPEG